MFILEVFTCSVDHLESGHQSLAAHISLKLMLQVKLIIILNYCKCYCLFPLKIKIGHHRFIPSRISALFPIFCTCMLCYLVIWTYCFTLFNTPYLYGGILMMKQVPAQCKYSKKILKNTLFTLILKKCPISILRRQKKCKMRCYSKFLANQVASCRNMF